MTDLESQEFDRQLDLKKDEIIAFYKNCLDRKATEKHFNISYRRLTKIFKKYGIITNRSLSMTKYERKEFNFLENLDEEWKYYFLGFFYADGNLSPKCNGLILKITDEPILQKLNDKIYVNKPLSIIEPREKNRKTAYGLIVSNKYIYQTAEKIGLTPCKSLTIDFPEQFANSPYLGDFIRGYFDGDGCICKYVNKDREKARYSVSMCVSKPFGEKLKSILETFNIKCTLRQRKDNKIHSLDIESTQDRINFYKLLYGHNPEFYLERKKVKFEEFMGNDPTPRIRTSKYKMIGFEKNTNKWSARFYNAKNKKVMNIGKFKSEIEAYNAQTKFIKENNSV